MKLKGQEESMFLINTKQLQEKKFYIKNSKDLMDT